MSIQNQINSIKDKLQKLRELDQTFQIFGSEKHLYKFNPVKTEMEVEIFESKHQILLPLEYKVFIQEIGNGGAGPYYGLEPLENGRSIDLDQKNNDALIELSKPFPHTSHWNLEFGYLKEEDENEYFRFKDEYYDPKHLNGLLRISNFGCGISLNLVVNGPEYGHIWADDITNGNGLFPDPYFQTEKRLTFLEWYELWLDVSIADCE